ncbi:MAG: hypothetical protein J07AB43_00660 [Candidatus Nanosalina sp. J07AB43]|jgi:hypothetical protein|nr:MAG: hypothetical protein J07AB43_00660 [Candidatus Nanosalina sp. J07AB43]
MPVYEVSVVEEGYATPSTKHIDAESATIQDGILMFHKQQDDTDEVRVGVINDRPIQCAFSNWEYVERVE